MYQAWLEKPTVNYVVKKCGFHRTTVERYRREDKWDEKAEIVSHKIDTKVGEMMVTENAKYITIAEGVVNVFAKSLVGHVSENCPHCGGAVIIQVPNPKIGPGDFGAMVALVKSLRREDKSQDERKIIIEHVYPEGYEPKGEAK